MTAALLVFLTWSPMLSAVPDGGTTKKVDLMLIGSDKRDAFGRPIKRPDKVRLRRMIRERRFAELTRIFEAAQLAGETNCDDEELAFDVVDAVALPKDNLLSLLEEWEREAPASVAPLLALGQFWSWTALDARGGALAKDVKPAAWKAMRDSVWRGRQKFEASLKLHPTEVAYSGLIDFAKLEGSGEERIMELFNASLAICPGSASMHLAAMGALVPKWGGSYEKMQAIAEAGLKQFPALKALEADILMTKCADELGKGAPQQALEWCDKATAFGSYWGFHELRIIMLKQLGRDQDALAMVDEAIEHRPQSRTHHMTRSRLLRKLGRTREADAALAYWRSLGEVR